MKDKSSIICSISTQFPFIIGKDVADNKTTETVNLKDCSPPAYSTISMPDNLYREDARLRTFDNWPHRHICPQKLAKTGFYFIGPNNDNVRCYFCKVEIGCWEQDDDEVTEHMRWSQNCPLLRRRDTNNVPIDAIELDRILPPQTFDVCGHTGEINVLQGSYAESSFTQPSIVESPGLRSPEHPEFAIEAARIRSFKDWPKTIKQKPKELSDAGFFYTERGDRVKCFSCGGGLRDWDENDIPWEQHALWFSKCEYLKLMKGQKYIDSILEKKKQQDECECIPSDNDSSGYEDGPSEKKLCDSKLCKICYTCEYNTAFFPCGHVVACAKCASSVTKCPLCRKPFETVMRVYFS